MTRTRWTDAMIDQQIIEFSGANGGRMPSANELRLAGLNNLACVIAHRRGFRAQAARLGLPMKSSETLVGREWEAYVVQALEEQGVRTHRQTVRAKFDILVDDRIRVDVKSANYTRYERARDGAIVQGFVFSGCKRGKDCDFFVALCIRGSKIHRCFVIPSNDVGVHTITITPKTLRGEGKWSRYACNVADIAYVMRAKHVSTWNCGTAPDASQQGTP